MSATLTSCGTFDLFLRQSGLSVYRDVKFLRVDSPFDYRANAKLVVPAMRADPSDAEAHTQEVVDRMPNLVRSRRALQADLGRLLRTTEDTGVATVLDRRSSRSDVAPC
jgi:ATP-dependent DNA helicase DinG